ncbi:MAG: capsule assembly Wzi family protein, partial [Longimicrobiales bacterium]|nr:capsule assembly Wzi family protein [Longimicrobiales bacterium]
IRRLVLGQRPYSRMAFARATAEARERMDAEGSGVKPRLAEALQRLEGAFVPEARRPCAGGAEDCPPERFAAYARQARLDLTAAESPFREIPTRYLPVFNVDGENLDADLNPLLQSNQGRELADGATLAAEAWADAQLGHHLSAQAMPRAWLTRSGGDGFGARATLMGGYVRGLFGNLAVDVGRTEATHGHARTYGPVLSHNPRGFDLVRLSMEEPRRLPWVLRALGTTRFAAWVADMGRDQDTPGSKLFVVEAALRPHPNLELGGSLLNHQGGKGSPDATLVERLRDLLFLERRPYLPVAPNPEISDKVLAVDARLGLPGLGAALYFEGMTTDDHNLFMSPRDGLWNNAAWTGGVEVAGLGREGRTDLWLEANHAGVRAYTHHQFTTGMALDRRVLGTPVGPLGAGIQGGVTWNGSTQTVQMGGAWERYAGDLYEEDPESHRFLRIADNPDEVRVRTTLDWTRVPAPTGVRTTVRLGYEHVTRFDFTKANRSNFLAQVSVGYVW